VPLVLQALAILVGAAVVMKALQSQRMFRGNRVGRALTTLKAPVKGALAVRIPRAVAQRRAATRILPVAGVPRLATRAHLMTKAKAVMKVLLAIKARLMTKAKAVMKVPGVTGAKVKTKAPGVTGAKIKTKVPGVTEAKIKTKVPGVTGEGTFLITGRDGQGADEEIVP